MKGFFVMHLILALVSLSLALPATHIENTNINGALKDVIGVQAPTCVNGFIAVGENCYLFDSTPLPWDSALSICNSLGAMLAHPLDYDENRLIVEYLLDNYEGYGYFWLGADDQTVEGQWVWSEDNSALTYSDWGYEQPDNLGGNENCLLVKEGSNWAWGDATCSLSYPFICQQN